MHKNRAVFLDRDGVINELVARGNELDSPMSLDEFKYIPGIHQAVTCMAQHAMVFVVTNQAAAYEGRMLYEELDKIHKKITDELEIHSVYMAGDRSSPFYKPGTKMFEYLISAYNIDPLQSCMIGDRWKDIVPAHLLGITTFVVGDQYKYEWPDEWSHVTPDYECKNAFEASGIIMEKYQ